MNSEIQIADPDERCTRRSQHGDGLSCLKERVQRSWNKVRVRCVPHAALSLGLCVQCVLILFFSKVHVRLHMYTCVWTRTPQRLGTWIAVLFLQVAAALCSDVDKALSLGENAARMPSLSRVCR